MSSKISTKRILSLFLAILFVFSFTLNTPASVSAVQHVQYAQQDDSESGGLSGQILVKFKEGIPSYIISWLNNRFGTEFIDFIPEIGVYVLSVPQNSIFEKISEYIENPFVQFAEQNYTATTLLTPNDPYFESSQPSLKSISPQQAWDISAGTSSVTVAVIDTGSAFNHEDLSSKFVQGYDFVNNDSDPSDDNGHGTMVSGIISAATDNNIGIAGVSWHARIMPVKVLSSSGSGSYSNIAKGITYAADNGAKVINMSLGGTFGSSTLLSAINYAYNKGVVLIAAAGNNNGAVNYPAAYSNVIAVSAIDDSGYRASFSCYGSQVDVAAPGVNVISTEYGGGYRTGSGTSFSAPFVSGLAALLYSVDLSYTPSAIKGYICNGAVDLGTNGWDKYYGWGRIDLNRSLSMANAPTQTPSPTSTPTPSPTPTPTPTSTPTPTPTLSPTPTPTPTPSPSPSPTSTPVHTSTPIPTASPSPTPTAKPSASPTSTPVIAPSPTPTPLPDNSITYIGVLGDSVNGNQRIYNINVVNNGIINVALSWSGWFSNLDLYLYDSSGNQLAKAASSSLYTLRESISAPVSPGAYSIKIVSVVTRKALYTMKVTMP